MALPSKLLHPLKTYAALRDQLGSLRGIYLAGDRIRRRDDMGNTSEVVLLLHGFLQTRNIWSVMEDRLRHDGYAVVSFQLRGLLWRFNTRPIDHTAALVASKVEALAERHGFKRMHIIGHSKGGLIARRWIQHYDGDRRVLSLTTLGTPHHGTPTALVGLALSGFGALPTSARELLPRSGLISALGRDAFPAPIPLTSIFSREDLVCPARCSRLHPAPGEEARLVNEEVRQVGHSELAWDPGVYRLVRRRLEIASALWQERAGVVG